MRHAAHLPRGRIEGTTTLGDTFERTLRGARRGRARSWDALYADLAPLVLGYLRARRVPDAEDVCAETFLQVVRDLPRFSGDETNLRSWVLTIAHHRATDARRRAGRRPSDPTADEDLERALPPTLTTTEADALARLGTEDVLALLDLLSEDQREVLLLRLLAGMTTTEIGEVTGRSREAVKALQKRGIARLRTAWFGDEAGEPTATRTVGAGSGPEDDPAAFVPADTGRSLVRSADADAVPAAEPPPTTTRER